MAPRRQDDPRGDPRVTDLRRYRRERERAEREKAKGPDEPLLGRNRKGGLFVVLVIAVLAALGWLNGHHVHF